MANTKGSGSVRAAKRVSAKPKAATSARRANETAARRNVIDTACAMHNSGLSPGRSGNVSMRWSGGMLITPSGVPYGDLTARDIVHIASDGGTAANALKPSSEWRFHLAAYQARNDCHAVVHAHSLNATALACRHLPIPAFHYMVAVAGNKQIPCVPYATFGTEDLAAHVIDGLAEHNACLMANHGQIAIGRSLAKALELAEEVETLAAQYIRVLALGEPKLLSEAEMDDVLSRFQSYGQHAQES